MGLDKIIKKQKKLNYVILPGINCFKMYCAWNVYNTYLHFIFIKIYLNTM